MTTRRQFVAGIAAGLPGMAAEPARHVELNNDHFRVRVRVGPDGVWLDRLSLNKQPGWPGRGFTPNLVAESGVPMMRSGTAILPEGGEWYTSRAGDVEAVRADARSMVIPKILLGPATGPLAEEEWRLDLEGARLRWRIARTMLESVKVVADRCPALVFRTGGPRFSEIPGFLDTRMQLDGARGFVLDRETRWHEVRSPRRDQVLHLAPSGLALRSRLSSGAFSYAKAPVDGTAVAVSVGGTEAGAIQEWTVDLGRHEGVAPFHLSLPDTSLAEECRSFAAVHNQWMGWIFGNNPASVPCLHEMAWFPMIQGIYGSAPEARQAMDRQLRFFADAGTDADGYVFPRWWIEGFYRVVWGNLLDQVPHFILAVYFHALNTGDREYIRGLMPAVERVSRYLLALDADGDGVFEVPRTSGLPDGGRDCSNWYDIIKFGHKDAYFNAYCVIALGALAELQAWLGSAGAADARRRHRRAIDAYNRIFWDDANGFYMDWIDTRGNGRRYFYTDHNLLAIVFGIAGAGRARRILANLDRRYAEISREFKLPREAIWATPCNMIPVTQLGDLVDFGERQNQKRYPNYENGCAFFHSTGLEIAARAAAGQTEAAYDVFERVMRHGYARNRLWAAALKWDTGTLISEPLNNALLILWGFLRGCFGAWPSLDGIRVSGQPSKRMEGARYTFAHLGRDVTLEVRNGRTTIHPRI